MALLFARHGRCKANEGGYFAGQTDDSPLIDLGRTQALDAATAIRQMPGIRIGEIWAAPLTRTTETAQIIAGAIGYEGVVCPDPRLFERDFGELVGTRVQDLDHYSHLLETAESIGDLASRVTDFVCEHADREGDLLMVSSAGVWRVLEAKRIGIPDAELTDKLYDIPACPNGFVTQIDTSWLD